MRRNLDFHLQLIRFGIIRFGSVRIPKLRYSVFRYFTRFGRSLYIQGVSLEMSGAVTGRLKIMVIISTHGNK